MPVELSTGSTAFANALVFAPQEQPIGPSNGHRIAQARIDNMSKLVRVRRPPLLLREQPTVTDSVIALADRSTDIAHARAPCAAAMEQHYIGEIRGTKRRASLSPPLGGAHEFSGGGRRVHSLGGTTCCSTAASARTITGVARSVATSAIFVMPANMISISCK